MRSPQELPKRSFFPSLIVSFRAKRKKLKKINNISTVPSGYFNSATSISKQIFLDEEVRNQVKIAINDTCA